MFLRHVNLVIFLHENYVIQVVLHLSRPLTKLVSLKEKIMFFLFALFITFIPVHNHQTIGDNPFCWGF